MIQHLIFRLAKHNDLTDIIRLLAEDQFGSHREKPLSAGIASCYLEAFKEILADSNQALMVVEEESKVMGTCHLTFMPSLTFQGSKRMNIEAVRVDKSSRGRGIGKWMIQSCIKIAIENNCKIIQLTTNKKRMDAKNFYEKLGFEATHEGMKMVLANQ